MSDMGNAQKPDRAVAPAAATETTARTMGSSRNADRAFAAQRIRSVLRKEKEADDADANTAPAANTAPEAEATDEVEPEAAAEATPDSEPTQIQAKRETPLQQLRRKIHRAANPLSPADQKMKDFVTSSRALLMSDVVLNALGCDEFVKGLRQDKGGSTLAAEIAASPPMPAGPINAAVDGLTPVGGDNNVSALRAGVHATLQGGLHPGVPAPDAKDGTNGFAPRSWALTLDKAKIAKAAADPSKRPELKGTLVHESRHGEQAYKVARLHAEKGEPYAGIRGDVFALAQETAKQKKLSAGEAAYANRMDASTNDEANAKYGIVQNGIKAIMDQARGLDKGAEAACTDATIKSQVATVKKALQEKAHELKAIYKAFPHENDAFTQGGAAGGEGP